MEETLRRLAAAMNHKVVQFFGRAICPDVSKTIIGVKQGESLLYANAPMSWQNQHITREDIANADPVGILIAAERIKGGISELDWDDIENLRLEPGFYWHTGFTVWDMDESRLRRFTLCYECHDLLEFTENNSPFEYNGDYYCDSCRDDNFTSCAHCSEYVPDNDTVFITDTRERVCESCAEAHYYRCEECGDYISENHGDDNVELCEDCRHRNYFRCCCCGGIFHENRAFFSESLQAYLCESCCDEDTENGEVIYSYSYKPSLSFYNLPEEQGNLPYLGFELESGGLDSNGAMKKIAREIQDKDYYVLKSDSSIPNYGFELVSQPMTLAYHRQFRWQNVLEKMSGAGLLSHGLGREACGLHVHVSKKFLRAHHWLIVDWFVSRCQKQWEIIARRPECHWAKFRKLNKGERVGDKFGKKCRNRYQAVNFENNCTVEFRLFRGTLKYETFMATLEVVDCLVRWAKQARAWDLLRCNGQIWSVFIKYLKENSEKYPYAVVYLTAKGLM